MNSRIYLALLAAIFYPLFLNGFNAVLPKQEFISLYAIIPSILFLIAALAVPILGFAAVVSLGRARPKDIASLKARRLAYLTVAAPTLYVLTGVLLYMAGTSIPEELVWITIWLIISFFALTGKNKPLLQMPPPIKVNLRIFHGITGSIVALFVFFHIVNHLFGLISPEAHAEVMAIGRMIYRIPVVEAILVSTMIIQILSGLWLAWKWSAHEVDFPRIFQIGSGVYLSLFILGHMNSVFIFARTYLGIQTGWDFATGAPTGLINDPWNIRLLPHYILGVFFVLSHLISGLRIVLLAHGTSTKIANRIWWIGLTISALIAIIIIAGMCGLRI
ncbi:hypothetical protein ASC84_22000 [Acinetobacter sp. Root1280]|uniref:hypothetical protein n=1 Tax=Acinetobacter sp. Root1280 TaxID=1736444 RepID=UPI0006F532A0|nr:hypothetical protein [Acinetobacter sp. Root1280]KQW96051.1 hypothetical protein ASC84_22000 [Acinetobacter sp. Root1280]